MRIKCKECSGSGGWSMLDEHLPEYHYVECPVCDGRGYTGPLNAAWYSLTIKLLRECFGMPWNDVFGRR